MVGTRVSRPSSSELGKIIPNITKKVGKNPWKNEEKCCFFPVEHGKVFGFFIETYRILPWNHVMFTLQNMGSLKEQNSEIKNGRIMG